MTASVIWPGQTGVKLEFREVPSPGPGELNESTSPVGMPFTARPGGAPANVAVLVNLAEREWNEETVREATLRGSAAGALACTDYGAMRVLPTREEMERFIAVWS